MPKCVCTGSLVNQRKVTIQRPKTDAASRNDYDENDYSVETGWLTYCESWGSIRNASGRERFADDQTIATRDVVISLQGNSKTRQINATYRAKYRDRDGVMHTLGIVENRVSEDGYSVELHCKELA